jgi:hypothetical protein
MFLIDSVIASEELGVFLRLILIEPAIPFEVWDVRNIDCLLIFKEFCSHSLWYVSISYVLILRSVRKV